MRDLGDLHKRLRRRLKGSSGASFLPEQAAQPKPEPPAAGDSFLPGAGVGTSGAPVPVDALGESFLPATSQPSPGESILPPLERRAETRPLRSGTLEELLPGEQVVTSQGTCWRIRQPGSEVAADSPALHQAWLGAPRGRRKLHEVLAAPPGEVVFLDIETCGLRGLPLFLVGLARLGESDVEVDYLLARQQNEEPAVLALAAELLVGASWVVTFNGSTFDLPYLEQRRAFHRTPPFPKPAHCDLLDHARRIVGQRFGDCRLQTLERELCRRPRPPGDVPGAQIPSTYQRWVDTRDAGLLAPIVTHNGHDLLTMVGLLTALADFRA
ncbi:MAG: ribonuclease H-like domain-containing protein [Armatimonadetes bacterium]|nr:ribonuclease H-like domain-containing protein [Armatimonadota bacterium]